MAASTSVEENEWEKKGEYPFLIEHQCIVLDITDPEGDSEYVLFKIETIFEELVDEVARLFPKDNQILEIRSVEVNKAKTGRFRRTFWLKNKGEIETSSLRLNAIVTVNALDFGGRHELENPKDSCLLERISLRLLEVKDKIFFYKEVTQLQEE